MFARGLRRWLPVVVLSVLPFAFQQQYPPAEQQYPGDLPAFPTFPPGGAASDIFGDATACWSMDDTDDLGNDDCTGTYDLSPRNTPVAWGGAPGYVADFDEPAGQYAKHDPGLDFTDEDFMVCGWAVLESYPTPSGGPFGEADALGWALLFHNSGFAYSYIFNGAIGYIQAQGPAISLNARIFTCIVHDSVGDLLTTYVDGSAGTPVATGGGFSAGTHPFRVGSYATTNDLDGQSGPVWVWDGSYSTADITTLYNSGKGYACAGAPALLDEAEHCWEMDEDGGPYADSIGSMTLTAVNAPTQINNLVERSDSGMSVRLSAAALQTMTSTALLDALPGDITFAGWCNVPNVDGSTWITEQDAGGNNRCFQLHSNVSGILTLRLYDTDDSSLTTGGPAAMSNGVWHLVGWTYDSTTRKGQVWLDNASGSLTGALPNGLKVLANASFHLSSDNVPETLMWDNVALWPKVLDTDGFGTLWNSGAGTFYSLYLDWMLDQPYFAWSQPPTERIVRRKVYVR